MSLNSLEQALFERLRIQFDGHLSDVRKNDDALEGPLDNPVAIAEWYADQFADAMLRTLAQELTSLKEELEEQD